VIQVCISHLGACWFVSYFKAYVRYRFANWKLEWHHQRLPRCMFLYPLQFLSLTMAQISVEDVSIERELYKGRRYRLHAAKMSGKIVAMKVYEGNRAREVVGLTTTNYIYPDYFVEALFGSCQIQSESYVWRRPAYSTMVWNWRFGHQPPKYPTDDWSFSS